MLSDPDSHMPDLPQESSYFRRGAKTWENNSLWFSPGVNKDFEQSKNI